MPPLINITITHYDLAAIAAALGFLEGYVKESTHAEIKELLRQTETKHVFETKNELLAGIREAVKNIIEQSEPQIKG